MRLARPFVVSLALIIASPASANEGRLFLRLVGPEMVEMIRGTEGGRALVSGMLGREIRTVTNDDLAVFAEELIKPHHGAIAEALETRLLRLERGRIWLAAHRGEEAARALFRRMSEIELAGLIGELERSGNPTFALTREMFLRPDLVSSEEIAAMGMRPPRRVPHPLDEELARIAEAQRAELLDGRGLELPAPWTTDMDIAVRGDRTLRLGDALPASFRNDEVFASTLTNWRIGTQAEGFFGRPLVAEADLAGAGTLRIEMHSTGGIRVDVFHPEGVVMGDFRSKVRFAIAEARRLTGDSHFRPRLSWMDGRGGGMTEIRGLTSNDAGPASAFLQLLTSSAPL